MFSAILEKQFSNSFSGKSALSSTPLTQYPSRIASHCDICGIQALDGQEFAEERLPFRRAKRYCANCHRRFYERVYLLLALFILAAALLYFVGGFVRGRTNLIANAPTGLLVLLFQWPLIVAHELGHGLFARAFGYGPVRLFIGFGKTLFHFTFLGFTWVINLIPFGGLAYATPDKRVIRWQWILFVFGGLLVNLALLAVVWILIRADFQLLSPNILQALLFANALVIIENILPYTAQTLFGPLDTDGKLLYRALFYWNKPAPQPKPASKAQRWIFTLLKIVALLFLVLCAALLLFLGGFVLYDLPGIPLVRFSLGFFLLGLGVILCWYILRLLKELFRPAPAGSAAASFWNEPPSTSTANSDDLAVVQTYLAHTDYQSVRDTTAQLLEVNPNDKRVLWMHANALLELNEPAAAEAAYDRLLVQLAAADPSLIDERETYLTAATKRLLAIMLQNDGRFESECTALLRKIISGQEKVTLLDQLACLPLIQEQPHLYQSAEFCIRQALTIAPESLTLKGTLGGLLAERGNFAEAEPLLRACDESSSIHDRAITSYYLARVAENSGDPKTARKLAKDSIALYPEPWLVKKANTLLNRLRQP